MLNTKRDARLAEWQGWTAYRERRGNYSLAVAVSPGECKPWEKGRYNCREQERKRYTQITCVEAVEIGFFGRRFPAYDIDPVAALELLGWLAKEKNQYIEIACDDKSLNIHLFGEGIAHSAGEAEGLSLTALPAAIAEAAEKVLDLEEGKR